MARATLADLAALGLAADALRTIPTQQGPITSTSAAGAILPGGSIDVGRTLVGTYDLAVEILAAGAPGVATFRYSLDGGTTWSSTITSPAAGRDTPLAVTGLKVAFDGALAVGDRFEWTATSAAVRALEWATGQMDSGLRDRYGVIVAPYPAELIGHEAALAAHRALAARGFDPKNKADVAVLDLRDEAMAWRKAVAQYELHPAIVSGTNPTAVAPLSDPLELTSTVDAGLCACDDF